MQTQKNNKNESNLKLIIPTEVENIIRYFLNKFHNIEWSGILFYDFTGSIQDKNLEITCRDILLMDKGDSTSTSIEYNPEIANYIANHLELTDCKLGLVHSHHSMSTFFSNTDINTLKSEGKDRVHFVSLIVNNEGTYSAAITRRIKRKFAGDITYESFNGVNVKEPTEFEETLVDILDLKVIKEGGISEEYVKRAKEIDTKVKSNRFLPDEWTSTYKQGSLFNDTKYSETYHQDKKNLFDDEDYNNSYNSPIKQTSNHTEADVLLNKIVQTDIYKNSVEAAFKELITGSILLNHESKVDIQAWSKNMSSVYNRRFGPANLSKFNEWAESYVQFVRTSYIDDILDDVDNKINGKFDYYEVYNMLCDIFTEDIISKMDKVASNAYLDCIIDNLRLY